MFIWICGGSETPMKYTILLYFPLGNVYPMIGGGFTPDLNSKVKYWDNADVAEEFAEEMCGKYGYDIIEVPDKKKEKKPKEKKKKK